MTSEVVSSSMKVLSICSPDRISLNMCLNFLRGRLGRSFPVGELHILMSKESIETYVHDFLEKNGGRALFILYAKRKVNIDPMKVVPEVLMNVSDTVIWFNLYSTTMNILKDTVDFKGLMHSDWVSSVEKLGRMQP